VSFYVSIASTGFDDKYYFSDIPLNVPFGTRCILPGRFLKFREWLHSVLPGIKRFKRKVAKVSQGSQRTHSCKNSLLWHKGRKGNDTLQHVLFIWASRKKFGVDFWCCVFYARLSVKNTNSGGKRTVYRSRKKPNFIEAIKCY